MVEAFFLLAVFFFPLLPAMRDTGDMDCSPWIAFEVGRIALTSGPWTVILLNRFEPREFPCPKDFIPPLVIAQSQVTSRQRAVSQVNSYRRLHNSRV